MPPRRTVGWNCFACLGANLDARQAEDWRINTARPRLAAVDQIWPRFANQILHRPRDDEGRTLRQEEAQNPTVELPEPVRELVRVLIALSLPPMGEQAVHN